MSVSLDFGLLTLSYSDNLPYAFCEQIGKEIRDISDEIPFEIPESWEWVRLGIISTYNQTKQKINAKDADASIWGLDLEDIEKGGRLLVKKTVEERKAVGDKTLFSKGDILYSKLRPYLLKILVAPDSGICTPEIVPFTVYGNISAEYIVSFLKSPYVDGLVNGETYGVKMPRAGTETMVNLLVPLPPINEQHRIVAKIEELLPYIEKYGKAEEHLTALNATFPEALKKSILQEAVRGKLVPQNPDDEPASVLLERIRAEKQALIKAGRIKRDKHESVIVTRDKIPYEIIDGKERCIADEVPFEIPESWCWCRLASLGITQTGNTPSKSNPANFGDYIPFIGPGDISNEVINYNNQGLSEQGKECGRVCQENSIIQVCIGGSIGKAAITNREISFNQQINTITAILCDYKYLYFSMISDYFVSYIKANAGGTATPIINRGLWDKILIPVPPLAEQHRIVAKIEEIMPYINTITK